MVEIVEVKNKKDIKEFIEFPLRLYKNCPYFVPMIYGDEKKMLLQSGKNDIAETVFYLAKVLAKTTHNQFEVLFLLVLD